MMDDDLDELRVAVRADTRGFAEDLAQMRKSFDATLIDGFEKAGGVLERGLLSAIRKGSLGFEDLKRIALGALDQIAAQFLQIGFAGIGGKTGPGGQNGSFAGLLGNLVGGLFGLPGRALGGDVAPQRPYLVGERGPELFVPTAAGRIDPVPAATRKEVRVAINLAAPRGTGVPVALQRSSRQVASAVRRALSV
ncbi:MAG: tail tape measure protein [Qipengyuania sp.]